MMFSIRKKIWSFFVVKPELIPFQFDVSMDVAQEKVQKILLNQGVSLFPDGIRLSWTGQLFEVENYRRFVSNFIRPVLVVELCRIDSTSCQIKAQFVLNMLAASFLFGIISIFNLFNVAALIAAICSDENTIQLVVAVVIMLFVTNLSVYAFIKIQFWLARRIIESDMKIIMDFMEKDFGMHLNFQSSQPKTPYETKF